MALLDSFIHRRSDQGEIDEKYPTLRRNFKELRSFFSLVWNKLVWTILETRILEIFWFWLKFRGFETLEILGISSADFTREFPVPKTSLIEIFVGHGQVEYKKQKRNDVQKYLTIYFSDYFFRFAFLPNLTLSRSIAHLHASLKTTDHQVYSKSNMYSLCIDFILFVVCVSREQSFEISTFRAIFIFSQNETFQLRELESTKPRRV